MTIKEALICGYFDEDCPNDYIVEISTQRLKEWFEQESLDLLDFETQIEKKIAVYNILEENFTEDLSQYSNFTVIFR